MNYESLRNHIRKQRKALTKTAHKTAADAILKHFLNSKLLDEQQHFACYHAHAGEINPDSIIQAIWAEAKNCYLPILSPKENDLLFLPFHNNTNMVTNRFGIPEPEKTDQDFFPAEKLDVVFLPLVAFDNQGHRIGMGAGFYDRTFEFCLKSKKQKPLLIGLAHDFQQVANIIPNSWDVPLDAILTPKGYHLKLKTKIYTK